MGRSRSAGRISSVTPYYEHDGIVIYHGDCREVLPMLKSQQFDLLLADPSYGDTSLAWDKRDLSWLECSAPLLKFNASVWCFGSLRMFMMQANDIRVLGWRLAQDVIWEKHNGSNFHNDRFRRIHEHAVQFYRISTAWKLVYKHPVMTLDATARTTRRKRRPPHMGHIEAGSYMSVDGGPRLMTSVIYVRSCHGYAEHETQKPIGILNPLIEYSCPLEGHILDPTMGVGSTLVAAKQARRFAVGVELKERFCEIAAKRLGQEVLPFGR